jgi:hypothetical protein
MNANSLSFRVSSVDRISRFPGSHGPAATPDPNTIFPPWSGIKTLPPDQRNIQPSLLNIGLAACPNLPDADTEMKKVSSRSEVVSCLSLNHSSWELLALAEAGYDESASSLIVQLNTQLRPVTPQACQDQPVLDWLPPDGVQRESVALEEAFNVAKDIFQSWVNRIKKSIPLSPEIRPPAESLTLNT